MDSKVQLALNSWADANARFPQIDRLFYQNLYLNHEFKGLTAPSFTANTHSKELWDTIGSLLNSLQSGNVNATIGIASQFNKFNVSPPVYAAFGKVIVETLKLVLHDSFDIETMESWVSVYLRCMPQEAAANRNTLLSIWQTLMSRKKCTKDEFCSKLMKEKSFANHDALEFWNHVEMAIYTLSSGTLEKFPDGAGEMKARYHLSDDAYIEVFGYLESFLEESVKSKEEWASMRKHWRDAVGRIMRHWGAGSKSDHLFYSADFDEFLKSSIETWEAAITTNAEAHRVFVKRLTSTNSCNSVLSKNNAERLGSKMWKMLGDTINSFQKWRDIRGELRNLGRIHSSYYGVRNDMYDEVKDALFFTFGEVLHEQFSNGARRAWDIVFTFMQLEMTKEDQYQSPLHSTTNVESLVDKPAIVYMPPTKEQISLVVCSWESARNTQAHETFYRKLQTMEKTQHLFASRDIRKLGPQLWRMIGFIVRSLKSFDKLKPILRDLGVRHTQFYGVTEDMYDIFGGALIEVLSTLCLPWTVELQDAWISVYGLLRGEMLGIATNTVTETSFAADTDERKIELMQNSRDTAIFRNSECYKVLRDKLLEVHHRWFEGMKAADPIWPSLWEKMSLVIEFCLRLKDGEASEVQLLKDLGLKHLELYGVTNDLYDVLYNAYLSTLEITLGGMLTEEDRKAWQWGFSKVTEHMRPNVNISQPSMASTPAEINFFEAPFPDFKQIGTAIRTWNAVVKVSPDSYKLFYRKMFEVEKCKSIFDSSEKSMESLGKKLWNMIGYCLKTMANFSKLRPILSELGKRHTQYYHVTPDMYLVSGNALLHTLSVILKEEWDEKAKEAWINVYGALASAMAKDEWLAGAPARELPDSCSSSSIGSIGSSPGVGGFEKRSIDMAVYIWERLLKATSQGGKTLFSKLMEDELCNSVFAKKDENGGKKLWNMLIFTLKNVKKNFTKVKGELFELGKKHLLVYGVTSPMYATLGKALHHTFQTHLPITEWDEVHRVSWSALYSEIADEMKRGADSIVQYKPEFSNAKHPSDAHVQIGIKTWSKCGPLQKGLYRLLADCEASKSVVSHVNIEVLGKKFMYMMDICVRKMSNFGALKEMLNKLGVQHSVVYGVTPPMYREFGESFLRTMRYGLGNAWTSKTEEAWLNIYQALASEMQKLVKNNPQGQSSENKGQIDTFHLNVVSMFWERVNRVAPESYRMFMVRLASNDLCKPVLNMKNLTAQGKKLWNMLGYTINHMRDFKSLEPMLNELGVKHFNQYGVTEDMYFMLEKALQETLESILKDEWSKAASAFHYIYSKLMNAMLDGVRHAQRSKSDSKPNSLQTKLAMKTLDTARRIQPNCAQILIKNLVAKEGNALVYKAKLELQAENIWGMFSYVVNHFDDYENTVRQLRDLGRKHSTIYGVTEAMYSKMKSALFSTLSEILEEMWTREVEHAWEIIYNHMSNAMILGASSGSEDNRTLRHDVSFSSIKSSTAPEASNSLILSWDRVNSVNPTAYLTLISKLAGHPDTSAVLEGKELQPIGKKFWNVLTYTIEAAKKNSIQKVKPILREVGKRHNTLYGVTPTHYEVFQTLFLQTLREVLRGEWTSEMESQWSQMMEVITTEMNGGFSTTQSVSQPNSETSRSEPEPSKLKHEYVKECIETWGELIKLNPQGYRDFYARIALDPSCAHVLEKRNVTDLGKRIWNMFGYTIRNLGKFNDMRPSLRTLGQKHATLYTVTAPMYDIMGESLLFVMQQTLGERYTALSKAAWGSVYTALASEMLAGVSEKPSTPFPGQRQTVSQIIAEMKSVNVALDVFNRATEIEPRIGYLFYTKLLENENCNALFPDKSMVEVTSKHTWNMLKFALESMKEGTGEIEIALADLGAKHKNFFGTTREMYIVFGGTWLYMFDEVLKGEFTAAEKDACSMFYAHLTNSMLRGASETEEFVSQCVIENYHFLRAIEVVSRTLKSIPENSDITSRFLERLVEVGVGVPNDQAEASRIWRAMGDALTRQSSHGLPGVQVDEISHINTAMRLTLQEEMLDTWDQETFNAWDSALDAFLQRSLDTVLYADDISFMSRNSTLQHIVRKHPSAEDNTPDIIKVYTSWNMCLSTNPQAHAFFVDYIHNALAQYDLFNGKSIAVEGATLWRLLDDSMRKAAESKRAVNNFTLVWHKYIETLPEDACEILTAGLLHTVAHVLNEKWTADLFASWLRVYLYQPIYSTEQFAESSDDA